MRLKISAPALRKLEIINVTNGRRLGVFSACELDPESGRILSISATGGSFLRQDRETVELPWECIVRIGADAVLAEREEQLPAENEDRCLKM